MAIEQLSKKRLVGPGEYVRNRFSKGRKTLSGVGHVLIASANLSLFVLLVSAGMVKPFRPDNVLDWFCLWMASGCILYAGLTVVSVSFKHGISKFKEAAQVETVELLVLKKADQLPAEETLVRASAEPTQEHEKVLLRASLVSEDTPPEQLLRPSQRETGTTPLPVQSIEPLLTRKDIHHGYQR
jgi:hypothetical protein